MHLTHIDHMDVFEAGQS